MCVMTVGIHSLCVGKVSNITVRANYSLNKKSYMQAPQVPLQCGEI